MLDIPGRVQVAIVDGATGAAPFAIPHRQVGVDRPASAAQPAGRVEAPDRYELAAVPYGFVLQHETKGGPSRIIHALGQLGSRQPTNVQILDTDRVRPHNKGSAGFMQKVPPLIRHLLMLAGELLAGALAAVAEAPTS